MSFEAMCQNIVKYGRIHGEKAINAVTENSRDKGANETEKVFNLWKSDRINYMYCFLKHKNKSLLT